MSPNILVTAATGVTGSAAIANLIKVGHQVRALAHREDDRSHALQASGSEVVFGDFNDYLAIKSAHKGKTPCIAWRMNAGRNPMPTRCPGKNLGRT